MFIFGVGALLYDYIILRKIYKEKENMKDKEE